MAWWQNHHKHEQVLFVLAPAGNDISAVGAAVLLTILALHTTLKTLSLASILGAFNPLNVFIKSSNGMMVVQSGYTSKKQSASTGDQQSLDTLH